jgi:hypothetical protein
MYMHFPYALRLHERLRRGPAECAKGRWALVML